MHDNTDGPPWGQNDPIERAPSSGRRGRAQVRAWLQRSGLHGSAHAVYAAMMRMADDAGRVEAGIASIGSEAGVSYDTAKKRTAHLRGLGLVELVRRGRGRAPSVWRVVAIGGPEDGGPTT